MPQNLGEDAGGTNEEDEDDLIDHFPQSSADGSGPSHESADPPTITAPASTGGSQERAVPPTNTAPPSTAEGGSQESAVPPSNTAPPSTAEGGSNQEISQQPPVAGGRPKDQQGKEACFNVTSYKILFNVNINFVYSRWQSG